MRRLEHRRARNLTLLAFAAVTFSCVTPLAWGAGPVLAVILLGISGVLHRRGYDVRRPIAAGIASLVISVISVVACERLFLRPAEVTGADEARQDRVEDAFDRAFSDSAAPPPPRRGTADASTLDGGAGFGDDAGTAGGQ